MQVVSEAQIVAHVRIDAIIEAVEAAFVALGEGRSTIFPVARGRGSDPSHFLAIKSALDGASGLMGVKVGSYNPHNRTLGRKAHVSTVMLIDDATAQVCAVVEAGYLNGMRTAAADAVAVKHLARATSRVLGVIGTGSQAVFEVEAIAAVRPIAEVIAAVRRPEADARFAQAVRARCGMAVRFASVEETVARADILVCATPSRTPLFDAEWVRPGTHVSAMGSDDVGKQELPPALYDRALFVMDHPTQAVLLGEAQHVLAAGLADEAVLMERSLGALLCGRIAGRTSDEEITVFDSTGVAVQDIAAAQAAMAIVAAAEARA